MASVVRAVGAVAAPAVVTEEKGNNDSGYAASQLEDIVAAGSPPPSPHPCQLPALQENPSQQVRLTHHMCFILQLFTKGK